MLSLRAALRTSMVTALLGTCVVPVAGTHSDDIDNLVTAMRATKRSQRLTKEPSQSEVLALIHKATQTPSQKVHPTY
ncbi:hypothetical protein Pmar_PMAR012040 [Perkinsus marinus ATCC 50983]|uniref:Uncharacterized protein n=1 Tax=Perkinsus marinus (strain ATCC 50983 / TXsc) TaxID=423536 RepID=C5LW95_PERM5|nr:hypothetical protein Pmar_PMAR012040 [Perkinsus marinus ATCC 50983]EEQ99032.1 hypothetical protein Pmar_PMAR012040 [Perkinsus marinus ATCC 50983]|eukprot:XP_002766315.1 hypothetical protein Pmar_PMAR012040 [Perkinsus marinus ATCC 50983]